MLFSRGAGPLAVALILSSAVAVAAPPPPSGAHPRMFLSTKVMDALTQASADKNSAMSALIASCQSAIDKPADTIMYSGYQGFGWSDMVTACALAWQVTKDPKYATAGIQLWRALLEDVSTLGDKGACLPGVDEATAILSVRRDTGYAIREIGSHTALAYDWLFDAPGATDALKQQSRDCFNHWITWYTREGYHRDEVGGNYHAGFVAAKTLISIAVAGEDGAAGNQMWTETVDDVFSKTMVANGLAQDNGGIPEGSRHGALVGGDWSEGWQYGPLSVMEYAFATRALEEQGVDLTPLNAWASDVTLREIYSILPDRSGMYVGGDMDGETYFANPNSYPFDATRVGPSSEQAAGWAAFMIQQVFSTAKRGDVWEAIADARGTAPLDPQQPPLPLWFLARGTRNLYARSAWTTDAFWTVFTSSPRQVDDHQHMDAANFVFVRGGDGLIVDPSPYGSRSTLTGNAPTIDSVTVVGDYRPSQTGWSVADMPLARGTASGVVAARGDFAGAFQFVQNVSDIKLARRDFVFLPEGEVITVDRMITPGASNKGYLRFRSPGSFTASSNSPFVASTTVGASTLAIHAVKLVPATAPTLHDLPATSECPADVTFGACRVARNKVGEYLWEVGGPDVLANHVFDGLGAGETPADTAPMDAPPIDSAAGENAGIIGTSVFRSQKQTFVVEPAALPAPATLTYGVPGGNPSRHVVFDAPADAMGRTAVTATVEGDRCLVMLTAGAGVTGAPAIFTLSPAGDGCKVSEDANVAPGSVSPGSGGFDRPGGKGGSVLGGCSCRMGAPGSASSGALAAGLVLAGVWTLARRRRSPRRPRG